jgi:hypothetical protein
MGKYGGSDQARYSRREQRPRIVRILSYFLFLALAVTTAAVVLIALRR